MIVIYSLIILIYMIVLIYLEYVITKLMLFCIASIINYPLLAHVHIILKIDMQKSSKRIT